MKTLASARANRAVHTAAWFYAAPRVVTVALLLGALALAAFLIFAQFARTWLERIGA